MKNCLPCFVAPMPLVIFTALKMFFAKDYRRASATT